MNKFDRDLDILLARLTSDINAEEQKQLKALKDKLIRLHEENVVKINHSVMELVCAKHLVLKGYEVDIERPVNGFVCDGGKLYSCLPETFLCAHDCLINGTIIFPSGSARIILPSEKNSIIRLYSP